MLPLLQEIFSSQVVISEDGERLPLHSHLSLVDGQLLQTWLYEIRPKRALEIGMAYGISSLFICEALTQIGFDDYQIVDPFQHTDWRYIGVTNMRRAGFQDAFILHAEPSELCLPGLLRQQDRFDFAFIDGFHTFDHALVDFFFINRMLEVNGIVVFDDIQLPSIQKLMAYIASYPCYKPLALPADWEHHRAIRVRRLMNSPLTRIGGFMKVADDQRLWSWYHEF